MDNPYELQEHDLMVRTVWAEARNQSRLGQAAVAAVILNRVTSRTSWWGNSIKDVCLKPWQFSCWNDNDPNRDKALALSKDELPYQDISQIVEYVMRGFDPTDGCDHYLVSSIADSVSWAVDAKPQVTIGDHTFYRLDNPSKLVDMILGFPSKHFV